MFMKNKFVVCALLGLIAVSSWLSAYVILAQSKQINQLEEQLQREKLKYKMLYRDPIVRKAIESGG